MSNSYKRFNQDFDQNQSYICISIILVKYQYYIILTFLKKVSFSYMEIQCYYCFNKKLDELISSANNKIKNDIKFYNNTDIRNISHINQKIGEINNQLDQILIKNCKGECYDK